MVKNRTYFLVVCFLLMFGCSKDNNKPDDDEKTDGRTYFETTISGSVANGDFKWDGSHILAMVENNDGVERAGLIFGYTSSETKALWGGMTLPPGNGTYKVTPDDGDVAIFEIAVNGRAFIQLDMTIKVTEYKAVEGTGQLRLIERIYGTFEGTVQTLAQTADQESGVVHTVKGKFGYNGLD